MGAEVGGGDRPVLVRAPHEVGERLEVGAVQPDAAAGADFFFDKSSDFEPLASTVRHLAEARQ